MTKSISRTSPILTLLQNSIFQKILVASSGLVLVAFVVVHLFGNLLLIGNPSAIAAFNIYAASLNRYPIVHTACELVLLIALVVHVSLSITIARRNRQAQPQNYIATPWWQKLVDRSMLITGPLLLLFLFVHLQDFRLGSIALYQTEIDHHHIADWQGLVTDTFQQSRAVGFYVIMMLPLAVHLRHGLISAGQSWGFVGHPGSDRASWFFAVTLAIGFAIIPLWIYGQK